MSDQDTPNASMSFSTNRSILWALGKTILKAGGPKFNRSLRMRDRIRRTAHPLSMLELRPR